MQHNLKSDHTIVNKKIKFLHEVKRVLIKEKKENLKILLFIMFYY